MKWFALRVRSRCEKLAANDLEKRGFEVCSACAPQRRVWADRVRTVEMPMFPGYIFARFDSAQDISVLNAAGVASIVGFGSKYYPVEESEIEAIQIVLRSGAVVTRERWTPGARVRVSHGPLRGAEGVLVHVKNQDRLVISVNLLQRAVAVEMGEFMLERIGSQYARPHGSLLEQKL